MPTLIIREPGRGAVRVTATVGQVLGREPSCKSRATGMESVYAGAGHNLGAVVWGDIDIWLATQVL